MAYTKQSIASVASYGGIIPQPKVGYIRLISSGGIEKEVTINKTPFEPTLVALTPPSPQFAHHAAFRNGYREGGDIYVGEYLIKAGLLKINTKGRVQGKVSLIGKERKAGAPTVGDFYCVSTPFELEEEDLLSGGNIGPTIQRKLYSKSRGLPEQVLDNLVRGIVREIRDWRTTQ